MADVFLCRQLGIGGFEKQVVLKRIRADVADDAEFITMFFDEARLAANLNHANIIQTFEVDQLDGAPYIAMEYVKGSTLSQLLRRVETEERQMEYGHIAHIFAGVCAGLEHAHNASDVNGRPLQIVHRDISPQNIIVSLDGTPKIFDFGIAKARGSLSHTGVDRIKGKFAYMAPEQLRGRPVDARADVYAVGVCLYEATVGHRPFIGGTDGELFALRAEGRFRRPSEVTPGFPTELEHIILSAMWPEVEGRPTADEIGERLARFCASGLFASSTTQVAAWIRELCSEEDAYVSYSSSPTLTPLSGVPAPALSGFDPRARGRRRRWPLAVAGLAVVGGAVVAALSLGAQSRATRATVVTADAPAVVVPQGADASLRAYLDEIRRNVEAKRYKLAATLLDDANAVVTTNAELEITREQLRHVVKVEQVRIKAHEALEAGSWDEAIALGSQLIDEDSDDQDALAIVAEARRRETVPAGRTTAPSREATVGAIRRPASRARVAAKLPSPKIQAIRATASAGSAAAGSGSTGSAGSGAVTIATPRPIETPRPIPAPAPVPVWQPPPPPALPPVAVVHDPGSLDATPSISRVAVDGSLTTSEVESAIARTIGDLRACYRSGATSANRTPELTLKLAFEIDEGARASSVRVNGDTLGIAGCVKSTVGAVRTRVAPDIGTVSVTATLRFKPTTR